MTEAELLLHAKSYIDQLAQGINPLTGKPVPEGELINNVRISRCFFYVSGVLGKVAEYGGLEAIPAKRRSTNAGLPPFRLSQDVLRRFDYSDESLLVSHIANRVNALVDTSAMKKLSGAAILKWLERIGMLEEVLTDAGKKSRRPTPQGNAMGISVEMRQGYSGPYQAVTYNRQAQQFIIDNMDAILERTEG